MTRPQDRRYPGRISIVLEGVRAMFGAFQLLAPALLAGRVVAHPLDRRARTVLRVLGARHLIQALASGRTPTRATLALGVEVDLLHAATSIALGIIEPPRRRVAFTDAVVAGSFAAAGALASRATRHALRRQPSAGALGAMRDRYAARLATTLVPGDRARFQER